MIKQDMFGLSDFKLVESSEQGMLAQVERSVRNKQPIVFWPGEPHPMNMLFDLKYLPGGDEIFGANYGGATITRSLARVSTANARTSDIC